MHKAFGLHYWDGRWRQPHPLSCFPMIISACLYPDTTRITLGLQYLLNNKFSVLLDSTPLVFFSIACFLPSHFLSHLCLHPNCVNHTTCPSGRDTNSWNLLKACSTSVQRPSSHKGVQPLGKTWIAMMISKVLFKIFFQWDWKITSATMMLFWQQLESEHEPKVFGKSRKGIFPGFGACDYFIREKYISS